jgi:hypothetical protein
MDKCTDYSTHSTGCQCHEARRDKIEADLRAEVARLTAIVDRLPLTADKVRVVPGMTLWPLHPWDNEPGGKVGMHIRDGLTSEILVEGDELEIAKNYSALAAAEAAMKKEGV